MSYVKYWIAYYTDGSSYSSRTYKPTELPQSGLQVWMIYFNDGTRRILHGNDYYFWCDNLSDDGIFGQSDDLPVDILTRYPGAYIIEGELMETPAYRTIVTRALKESR